MKKLNKIELIDVVAEKCYLSKKDSKDAIETALDVMEKALLDGKEVNLSNFGVFTPCVRKSRVGTDPSTHEIITIKEKKTVVFKPSKTLKAKLN